MVPVAMDATRFSVMKSLDSLVLFAAVARSDSLSRAAASVGVSMATLSRHIGQLEEECGQALFDRRPTGYALTDFGRGLLAEVVPLENAAEHLATWLATARQRPRVRLSAGTWTMHFLTQRFDRLWRPDDPFVLSLATAEQRLSLAYREIDLGLRSAPPTSGNLASIRFASVQFAPYCAADIADPAALGWLAVPPEGAVTGSAKWLAAQDADIVAWADSPRTLCDLALNGVGQVVLPCFAGDLMPGLRRSGPEIVALTGGQWLVMHDDTRHQPFIRTMIDRLRALYDGD